jgi:hypothetical protein
MLIALIVILAKVTDQWDPRLSQKPRRQRLVNGVLGPTCHVDLTGGTLAIIVDDDPDHQKTRKITPSNPDSMLNPIVAATLRNSHRSNSSEHACGGATLVN